MATKINTPITYGEHATLGVTTDVIAPYKYQWKRDGVNLAHGNNKSYTTPPLRAEDFRAKYSVTVYGQDKIETSDEVVINADVKAVAPISQKDKAAAATVVPPKPYTGPERRVHVGPIPAGMPERRVFQLKPKPAPAVPVTPAKYLGPERRVHDIGSPTGVERRA